MKDKEYRAKLNEELNSVYSALRSCEYLSLIFDDNWYQRIKKEIDSAELTQPFTSDSALMFFELNHWLRGVDWFEEIQRRALDGKISELSEDHLLALGFVGLDPLRTLLPVLDKRLGAFVNLTFKKEEVRQKLDQLRRNQHSINFRNHMMEVLVVGAFAEEGILIDIETPVGTNGSTVDAVIKLTDRPVYVEVTFTSKELRERPTREIEFMRDSPQAMMDLVQKKIRTKVCEGKQLALIDDAPTLLVIGRNMYAADLHWAEIVYRNCLADSEFAKLSGIIDASSWKFTTNRFYPSKLTQNTLNREEIARIEALLA